MEPGGKAMHEIFFYKDRRGRQPVLEYLDELKSKTDKNSRIKLNKIREHIRALREYGNTIGEPYMKHIDGEIWELRPLRDRIFFVAWDGDSFVLLHTFVKKSQKTPPREIQQAKREYADLMERGIDDEKE